MMRVYGKGELKKDDAASKCRRPPMNSSVKGGMKTEGKKPDILKKTVGFSFLKEFLKLK